MKEGTIKLLVLGGLLMVLALALHQCYRHFRGIEVCVHNVGTQTLRSSKVVVTSSISTRAYAVGDLPRDDTTCVWVKADSEASVDFRFTAPSGVSKATPLNGYIEPGYSGWISADVTVDGARAIEQKFDSF